MKKKKILLILVVILIGIQFIRIDRTNPEINPNNDFSNLKNPPAEVLALMKKSCYDCHSFETKYPWYANISPVSLFLKNHIDEGRKHLNFSEWGTYSEKRANRKIEECVEEIEKGEMPLKSYTLIHTDAQFTESEKTTLTNWLKAQLSPAIQ